MGGGSGWAPALKRTATTTVPTASAKKRSDIDAPGADVVGVAVNPRRHERALTWWVGSTNELEAHTATSSAQQAYREHEHDRGTAGKQRRKPVGDEGGGASCPWPCRAE